MRPIAVNQTVLRGARNELDSAREELQSALGKVHHPADDFPWRNLMVDGVKSLLDDAEQVVKRCRSIATAVEDSVLDFDELDIMVGQAAQAAIKLSQVQP